MKKYECTTARRGGGCSPNKLLMPVAFIIVGAIAVLALVGIGEVVGQEAESKPVPNVQSMPIPKAPGVDEVIARPHAIERHGNDAEMARDKIRACGDGLQVYYCPSLPDEACNLGTFFYICRLETLCAGAIVGRCGEEQTAYVAPCSSWYGKVTECLITEAVSLNE